MNKDEALKLALEALEAIYYGTDTGPRVQYASITAIKQALAQPEQDVDYWIKQHTEARQAELSTRRELEVLKAQPTEQEPVGFVGSGGEPYWIHDAPKVGTDLYTAHPEHQGRGVELAEFNAAINFAIDQASEAANFLRCWREGDTSEWPEFISTHGIKELNA
jgi:hypothetical protein